MTRAQLKEVELVTAANGKPVVVQPDTRWYPQIERDVYNRLRLAHPVLRHSVSVEACGDR